MQAGHAGVDVKVGGSPAEEPNGVSTREDAGDGTDRHHASPQDQSFPNPTNGGSMTPITTGIHANSFPNADMVNMGLHSNMDYNQTMPYLPTNGMTMGNFNMMGADSYNVS